ncbi:MAG: UbiD family decarboxylase [Dehalococcoidia bacterium]|nr:UbiD family decarboxylase [Dehalococcoidia bacterium]
MSEDLRDWLGKVQSMEEVRTVEGADCGWEIGAITDLNGRRDNAPALLFDKIKDYPPGFRVLSGAFLTPARVALTLGLPPKENTAGLLASLRAKLSQWEEVAGKTPPRKVKTGPVMENIRTGKKINVFEFPVPKWHEADGGRFIGTGHVVITRDPDTGSVNLGTYRVQAHDANTTGLHIAHGKHGWMHVKKYHDRGQPAPVALSVGHHPLVLCLGAAPVAADVDYSYLGAMMGKPFDVIEDDVTGLPIPADAEIVLVGWCPPDKTRTEGPFGEFTGYYASGARADWVIEVQKVYFRNNPILLGAPPGRGHSETSYYESLMASASLHNALDKAGVVNVKGVWTHEMGGGLFVVVCIKQTYGGHSKEAGLYALQFISRGNVTRRFVVVVDDDIDYTDLKDVVWAMSTRCDPEKNIDIIRGGRSTYLDPLIKKPASAVVASRAIIDACKPWSWIKEFPEAISVSPETVNKVKAKWGAKLGL